MADHIEDTMHDEAPPQVLDFVVKLPGKDAPGYLGRMRRLVQFTELQKRGELDLETYDALIEFILDFIASPPRDEARELLLWQVSEEQLGELMAAISGGGTAVPPV